MQEKVSRRSFLSIGGAATIASFAGCAGQTDKFAVVASFESDHHISHQITPSIIVDGVYPEERVYGGIGRRVVHEGEAEYQMVAFTLHASQRNVVQPDVVFDGARLETEPFTIEPNECDRCTIHYHVESDGTLNSYTTLQRGGDVVRRIQHEF